MTDLPDFRLDGKVALVTGASSGLGLRFAKVLAKAGAAVALAARRTDRLAGIEREIEAEGGKAISLKLDVTSARSVVDAFEATEAALGPVDILINNAGMNIESRAVDLPETEYDRMMDTNVKGAFLMAQQAAKRMIARKAPGRIVNIASIGAFTVLPGLAVYCMSKAAIAMMTRALAREWATRQINVTGICPGYIETELNADWFRSDGGQKQIAGFPRRRLGVEADLDGTLLLLCSDAGRIMTGTLVTVDDGQSL
ncbi:MAG: SDR family NAD(P)-dependent oxidoreductase [Alphaproteobacteria bacterium]|nr:SDR family NAD(P)-dependent oxidoreductase [Alphaproteobacteria bacterium]